MSPNEAGPSSPGVDLVREFVSSLYHSADPDLRALLIRLLHYFRRPSDCRDAFSLSVLIERIEQEIGPEGVAPLKDIGAVVPPPKKVSHPKKTAPQSTIKDETTKDLMGLNLEETRDFILRETGVDVSLWPSPGGPGVKKMRASNFLRKWRKANGQQDPVE